MELDLDIIVNCIENGSDIDPIIGNNAIGTASYYGYLDKVKRLLVNKLFDPSCNNNYAIRWASYNGHIDVVKFLVTDLRVDHTAWNNWSIWWACLNGHLDVVEFLFKLINVNPINFKNGQIVRINDIYYAIEDGEIVNWLSREDYTYDYIMDEYLKWQYRIGGEKWTKAKKEIDYQR
jgi:ankyrin repeat protein